MSDRMTLESAKAIAERVYNLLLPHCTRISIAGSVRREKEDCKDIEIVCLPGYEEYSASAGLFASNTSRRISTGFVDLVNSWEKVKGEPEGRYTQRMLPEGIKLDLFMPQATDYGRQLAIRTGPAEYSHKVLANGWLRKGWVGTDHGLRRKEQCIQKEKGKWVLNTEFTNFHMPPVFATEEHFFDFIQVKCLPPKLRTI